MGDLQSLDLGRRKIGLVVWAGGISGLALAASPLLVWWFFDNGLGLSIGGYPAPRLTSDHVGKDLVIGRLMIFFGIICALIWVQYGRNGHVWTNYPAAVLLIFLSIFGSAIIPTVLGYAAVKRDGLPMLFERAIIAPGLYLAVGASLVQCLCLVWLEQGRLNWARMQRGRE